MRVSRDSTSLVFGAAAALVLGFIAFKFSRDVFSAMNVRIIYLVAYMLVSYIVLACFVYYKSKSVYLSVLIFLFMSPCISPFFEHLDSNYRVLLIVLVLTLLYIPFITELAEYMTETETFGLLSLMSIIWMAIFLGLIPWIYNNIFSTSLPIEERHYLFFKYTTYWIIPAVAGFFIGERISAFFDLIYSAISEAIKKATLFIHSITIAPIKSYMQKRREEKARAERLKAEIIKELEELTR